MNLHNKKMADYREVNLRKKQKRVMICVIALIAVLISLVFVIMNFVLVVRDITVVGNSSYTDDEIIEACGIKNGKSIFSVSQKKVEKRLCDIFPYVKSVDIEREYPSGIILTVGEEHTTFYCEFNGEYFLYSYSMRVMDRFDSAEALLSVREGAIFTDIKGIKSAVVGEYIEFEGEEYGYVGEVIYHLSGTFYVHSLKSVSLSDKYDIRADYDSRIKLIFGSYIDFEKKAKNSETIMHDATEKSYGSVDVSNPKEGYASLEERN